MLKQLLRLFGFGVEQEKKPVVRYPKLVKPKGKLVAKKVYGYDADFMYGRGTTEPGLCPVCHNSLKKIPNPDYRMKKRKGDMFYTYDSFCIVSEKFKRFCELNEYEGLAFTSLPKSPGYYYTVISKESIISCTRNVEKHSSFWTETWANYLSKQYFGVTWHGVDTYSSAHRLLYYPAKNITKELMKQKFGL